MKTKYQFSTLWSNDLSLLWHVSRVAKSNERRSCQAWNRLNFDSCLVLLHVLESLRNNNSFSRYIRFHFLLAATSKKSHKMRRSQRDVVMRFLNLARWELNKKHEMLISNMKAIVDTIFEYLHLSMGSWSRAMKCVIKIYFARNGYNGLLCVESLFFW